MSLRDPIKLKDLVGDGAVFEMCYDSNDLLEESNDDYEYNKNLSEYVNLEVLGEDFQDEDTYIEGQPFQVIGKKMKNLLDDKIKKRIIRKGYGITPGNLANVKVNYNAYIEYTAEPFDSTYARNKPHQFTVNNGEVIVGLDIAVQSMMLNEKSQFLMTPELAYGSLGCLNRVPPNAEILFEIELLEIINAGAASTFHNLPEEKQRQFKNVYEYCLALCAKGKDLFSKNIKFAIKEYNSAVAKLEMAQLEDYDDQVKQQSLLLKLYTNLLVCYTKIEEPKKGCINFNKIKALCCGTDLTISAKCYYNNAKCLRILGEYDLAKKRLNKAYILEPKNPDILNEMVNLENEQKNYKKKQLQLGKALIDSSK